MRELTTTENAVCNLISLTLFGNPLTLSDAVDWKAVYDELSSHAVLGLFREALPSLPLPQQILDDWTIQNYNIIAKGIKLASGQTELIQLLNESRIPYAILKGTAAAQYYPIKHSRSLGDVDFIVKEEDYERTQKLLDDNGYKRAFEYEDNPRHESFNKNGIHYECHHAFAERDFSNAATIDDFIRKNIDRAVLTETEYGSFMSPPTAINGLVLLEHVAIHIKSGLGLRQILDWLLYVDQNLRDNDWAGNNGYVIRDTGLDTLAKVITRAGQIFLGLSPEITWCADAPEELCGELIRLVFSYGNFGSKNTIDDKIVGVARRYRRGILKNLKESGEHNWKILHRYPWLRPLAPIYQIGRYVVQVLSRKGALKALLSNRKAVDSRESLMRELRI